MLPRISRLFSFVWIFWAALDMHLVFSLSKEEVENHMNMAKAFLGKGQLADALSHYHAAIDGDPGNYMAYFKRATVYLALGRAKSALHDMERVIELKPDFILARIQRANLWVKQGNYEDAVPEYNFILNKEPSNAEARSQLELIEEAKTRYMTAQHASNAQDYHTALQEFGRVLEISPSDADLHAKRAEIFETVGDMPASIADMRAVVKLRAEQTQPHLQLSLALHRNGDAEESLNAIRECLKLDPDDKPCKTHYTFLRKLVKQLQGIQEDINNNQYAECVQKCDAALKTDSSTPKIVRDINSRQCLCLSKVDAPRGIKVCSALLEQEPDNSEFLMNRGEAYISNEQYEDAVRDFEEAVKSDNENRRAHEGLERAKKLLKQANRRDYYKILGVKRTANEKTITKAYRKLAKEWHPDRFTDVQEKENAQKKFMEIAAAMEVLTDEEKRKRFDAGEDPLDPEAQAQQGFHGFHPFGRGFNPFGQGGQTFTFHFGG
ncbi:dnaJ homolog subfamily C member 3-like [Paramacrobiotus metropolitanus]|uniref:dnaJ homolog subfamily C member 3-like n=1 Tax=Paramacrobiotus metropolitanus TaxID=2943436 RepID=UPI0024457FBC|nr:dnaJ homolog subfamily C member 3-like [Paramacrobiotus metropolitanus]